MPNDDDTSIRAPSVVVDPALVLAAQAAAAELSVTQELLTQSNGRVAALQRELGLLKREHARAVAAARDEAVEEAIITQVLSKTSQSQGIVMVTWRP
jgi:hypothetical protein